jgi:hypothetical protein
MLQISVILRQLHAFRWWIFYKIPEGRKCIAIIYILQQEDEKQGISFNFILPYDANDRIIHMKADDDVKVVLSF